MSEKRRKKKQVRGGILILFSLAVVLLFGFAALAVDIGYLFVVRNQLQNAADSAALAGASYLYPLLSTGSPNWSLAQTKALENIKLNKVDNATLTNATFQTGYWNIQGKNSTLLSPSVNPGQYDLAAIKVTVSKILGSNGGPVKLFFGPILGIQTMDVTADAIAVVGAPKSIQSSRLFPIAMQKSVYDTYWDSNKNSAKIDPKTGKPYLFQISSNGNGGGQWTTFNTTANDTNTLIDFINNGSPIRYTIGDSIWIAPGSKNSIYSSVPANVDIVVPVVANVSSKGWQTILAFGVLHIESVKKNGTGNIKVYFLDSYKVYEEPGGISYGVYTPSRISQ